MVYRINKTCATKLEGLQFGVRYVISLGFEYDNFFFYYRYTNLCMWFSLLDGFSNQSSIATNVILAKERKRNRRERDEGKEGERVGRKNWRREVIMKGEGGGRKGGVVNEPRDKVKLVSITDLLCA